jgi:inorganic pyrophosphatase
MNLLKLPPRDEDGHLQVVVESPKGSHLKLKYEPELKAFTLGRPLLLGLSYPFDWGFIPGTKAPDGDPLDAMILLDHPTYPGVVVRCVPVGVVKLSQQDKEGGGRERNDRIIATPLSAPRFDDLRDARKLPARTREEIEQFFLSAVVLEQKGEELLGWDGPEAAEALIEKAIAAAR